MKRNWLIAALALTAALLAAAHLRVPRSVQVWRLDTPAACERSGETMSVSLPKGDVDVNRASAAQLETLYGVGPALAQNVIAEREQNGDFHYPEDLINVNGIGETKLEQMREQLLLP